MIAIAYFCEYCEKLLLGRRFVLRTDHQSLTTILTGKSDNRKSKMFARWLERLEPFDFTLQYIKGSTNLVADALSRFPYDPQPVVRALVSAGLLRYYRPRDEVRSGFIRGATLRHYKEAQAG